MLSLFLPRICLHCDKPTASIHGAAAEDLLAVYLCDTCMRSITNFEGSPLDQASRIVAETSTGVEFQSGWSATIFVKDFPVQSVIHALKFGEMPRLARVIGEMMGREMGNFPLEAALLIPVPLHRTRFAERGYNQAELIAEGISKITGIPVASRGLARRIRPTPKQSNLKLQARLENVRGAFGLGRGAAKAFYGKDLVIVDDVMTTGATILSLAESLVEASPASISFVTFAAV